MKTEERIQKQKLLIEEIGRYFDREGLQPIASRILALLMVMDKEQYTFEEIVEELSISKSSASNALKNLEIRDVIEYVTLPGDRKRYFQVKRHNVFSSIEDFEQKLSKLKDLLVNILELKGDKNSWNSQYFLEMADMLEFFLNKMEHLKEEYKSRKTG
ncbi:MAG: GbsR/MarR family transcriptional regulator [Bacteroidota bacterium]